MGADIIPTLADVDDLYRKWKYAQHMAVQSERVNKTRAKHGQQLSSHTDQREADAYEAWRKASTARLQAIGALK